MTEEELKLWIKKNEGLKLIPYYDVLGNLTIGWGRFLGGGINLDEAELMFENDYRDTINDLKRYKWFNIQPDGVQKALINMTFNLGIERVCLFKKMIDALRDKNYVIAAYEAVNSSWAKQVGDRAKDIALMIREGK